MPTSFTQASTLTAGQFRSAVIASGWPEAERYSLDDMLLALTLVRGGMRALGYTWKHPRVTAYREWCSQALGQPIPTHHHLPYLALAVLAHRLQGAILTAENCSTSDEEA